MRLPACFRIVFGLDNRVASRCLPSTERSGILIRKRIKRLDKVFPRTTRCRSSVEISSKLEKGVGTISHTRSLHVIALLRFSHKLQFLTELINFKNDSSIQELSLYKIESPLHAKTTYSRASRESQTMTSSNFSSRMATDARPILPIPPGIARMNNGSLSSLVITKRTRLPTMAKSQRSLRSCQKGSAKGRWIPWTILRGSRFGTASSNCRCRTVQMIRAYKHTNPHCINIVSIVRYDRRKVCFEIKLFYKRVML